MTEKWKMFWGGTFLVCAALTLVALGSVLALYDQIFVWRTSAFFFPLGETHINPVGYTQVYSVMRGAVPCLAERLFGVVAAALGFWLLFKLAKARVFPLFIQLWTFVWPRVH
jgi:hypothetical protein